MSLDRTIVKKEIGQPAEIRRQEEQAQQDEMKRDLFDADIVGHVEHENLHHVRKADHCAHHRGPWNQQQDSTQQFRTTCKDFVRRGSADRSPENTLP